MKLFEYFPELDKKQKGQIEALFDLYKEWNEKINVISRKDIDNLYLHHVQHSLALAKYIRFKKAQKFWTLEQEGVFPVFRWPSASRRCNLY